MEIYLDEKGNTVKVKLSGVDEFLRQLFYAFLYSIGAISIEECIRRWLEYPVTYVHPDGRREEEYIPSYKREYMINKIKGEMEKE